MFRASKGEQKNKIELGFFFFLSLLFSFYINPFCVLNSYDVPGKVCVVLWFLFFVCVCLSVCVRACVRECVRACVCECVCVCLSLIHI